MDSRARIEKALQQAVSRVGGKTCPPGLRAAVQHAVFPGGARIRPQLCLAIAAACAEGGAEAAEGAAAAIELMHCASLVHDDLPCFDDAAMRRGVPSVHCAFGQPLAVLAGDALIVLAFETLAHAAEAVPQKLPGLLLIISRATGMPNGIVAGQAWELEDKVPLRRYQRAKTGSLFVAATMAGALASGANPNAWQALGEHLGEAYQVADDIRDVVSTAEELGKPVGQDLALARPSVVQELGLDGAFGRLEHLIGTALDSIPPCPGAAELRMSLLQQTVRLAPKNLVRVAA
jgi:geranylgeranyl diphosphate synthase, type II